MPAAQELPESQVKLITLLNVANAHPRHLKRSLPPDCDWHAIIKRAKTSSNFEKMVPLDLLANTNAEQPEEDIEPALDTFKYHFGAETELLSDVNLASINTADWTITSTTISNLGKSKKYRLKNAISDAKLEQNINPRLLKKIDNLCLTQGIQALEKDALLELLTNYQDLYSSSVLPENRKLYRATSALHAMNHVLKTRNRVLKNNEHLAGAKAEGATLDDQIEIRDQGFTRPKILILLPFRNSAAEWMSLLSQLSVAESVENKSRFDTEFSLPDGTVDKLNQPDAHSRYPIDHIATFSGNIDDTFRVGIKLTRKTIKCFSEFYQSDIILASPLGLRMSIEKEKDFDFLSSLEVVIVDQTDVMTMQNWEHVQFVVDRLNQVPTDSHGADFSRIKPWYLDGKSSNLRQTIIFSAYETPEINAFFNRSLKNVAGKTHLKSESKPVITSVKKGVKQTFVKVDVESLVEEDNARFEHFKTRTLPALMKSAVASSGHTLLFIPSYFDFLRVEAHLKTIDDLEFACISEYSSTSDISRARNAFLSGKLPFLIITERFYFFRRYRIRGARNLVFYGLPEHAVFYKELMTYPFEAVPDSKYDLPDITEVTAQVLLTKFDSLKLERIVGRKDTRKLIDGDDSTYTFA